MVVVVVVVVVVAVAVANLKGKKYEKLTLHFLFVFLRTQIKFNL
jgi:hypothetical protein